MSQGGGAARPHGLVLRGARRPSGGRRKDGVVRGEVTRSAGRKERCRAAAAGEVAHRRETSWDVVLVGGEEGSGWVGVPYPLH